LNDARKRDCICLLDGIIIIIIIIIVQLCNTETPLTLAALSLSNPQPMMQALVGGGAHLDFRNSHALTAIHRAALNCNRESIKVSFTYCYARGQHRNIHIIDLLHNYRQV